MHTLADVSAQFQSLNQDLKRLVAELTAGLEPAKPAVGLAAQRDHSAMLIAPDSSILQIVQGDLICRAGDRELYRLDEGDIVGLWNVAGDIGIHTDFAVVVNIYDGSRFLRSINDSDHKRSLWTQFLTLHGQIMVVLLGSAREASVDFAPQIRHYQAGETILAQGDPSTEVHTLLSGSCDVFVAKDKVGEVLADEIFGAVAAVMASPRTATVVARERVTVMSVPGDSFLQLIQSRPATALKLIADLCRALVATNSRRNGL